jgi:hypothetical protein
MDKKTRISKANFGGHSEDLVLNEEIIRKRVLNFKAKFIVTLFKI